MRAMFHFGKYVFGTNVFNNLSKSADHFITASAIADPVLGQKICLLLQCRKPNQ